MSEKRPVKLGRKILGPAADHWAVQVGYKWYEVAGKSSGSGGKNKTMGINTNYGDEADSGAGAFGGEIVGVTKKSDKEIDDWIEQWVSYYDTYDLITENCQKFAYELINWLTNGFFKLDHPTTSYGDPTKSGSFVRPGAFAVSHEGNAIASAGLAQGRLRAGPTQWGAEIGQFSAQAVAGPGFGAFADAKIAEASLDVGKVAGVHVGLNASTGAGVRNGNAEAHLLGFGGKVGTDGLQIDTPLGGVKACSIM